MAKTLDAAGVKRLIQEIKGANKNLNTAIPISTENTTESMAQNVRNIADYVEKAKAAGIANVDGMGVTCLINGGISGLGYIYVAGNSFYIIGMTMWDDMVDNAFFIVSGGEFNSIRIAYEGAVDTVTSDMLVEGARKPIIITQSTTEVDEETYQKLLSDDVDVVFKDVSGNLCALTYKGEVDNTWDFYFTCFSCEDDTADDIYIYAYEVDIAKTTPHTCTIRPLSFTVTLNELIRGAGYLNKSTLSPVLQEIDLTGTDAERKAKLDQFETDWKALTGASDLSNSGVRFVGRCATDDGTDITGVLSYDNAGTYVGIFGALGWTPYKVEVSTNGSIYITPLFSHLEAITIYTYNTPEHMQANLANIAAYEANLQAFGVDMSKGFNIPVMVQGDNWGGYISSIGSGFYVGFYRDDTSGSYAFRINADGLFMDYALALSEDVDNKVDKAQNAKSLEAITIKTGNKPESKAANVSAIKAYVDNLTSLGVDTTKGYMIPVKLNNGYHGFIMGTGADGNHTGVIKRDKYNYGGGWIFIDNIGTYQYLECLTLGGYDNLTTTAKEIIPAINEINANAVHSDKLVPTFEAITIKIGYTPEGKAANKAVIEAYRDNLTALGVDTTKGFMIPVKTDNGNGFIFFDGTKGAGYVKINSDCYGISIKEDYGCDAINLMSTSTSYGTLETTSKRVLPAINEVNALAKGYSTIFTPIELTTETAQNKTAIDARVAAFTAQEISLTNGCCIPVTYKGVYAGNISLINGDWYGLLVKNTNNPADNINIKLSADGTITEGNSAQ